MQFDNVLIDIKILFFHKIIFISNLRWLYGSKNRFRFLCGHIENCPVQGLCVKICEQGALIEEDGDVTIVPEKCDDCDLCIQNCPNQAISKA